MKPLYLPLHTDPFRKYERGSKRAEVRVLTPRWRNELEGGGLNPGRVVFFRRGHSKEEMLRAVVTESIAWPAGLQDLPASWFNDADLGPKPSLIPEDAPIVVFRVRDVRASSIEEYRAHAAVAARGAIA